VTVSAAGKRRQRKRIAGAGWHVTSIHICRKAGIEHQAAKNISKWRHLAAAGNLSSAAMCGEMFRNKLMKKISGKLAAATSR